MPKARFTRDYYSRLVVQALSRPRPNLQVGSRHDIFCGQYKVSGSAYRIAHERTYHHGTMLINTDLSSLTRFLTSPIGKEMQGEGAAVSSVVSPVMNIGQGGEEAIDHDKFCSLVIDEYKKSHDHTIEIIDIAEEEMLLLEDVCKYYNELKSDDWTFGKTPSFKLKLPVIGLISVQGGVIVESKDEKYLFRKLTMDLLETIIGSDQPSIRADYD